MDVGMLGLIYFGVGAGTFVPGVSGSDIVLVTSNWKTKPWFLVAVSWIHSVCVVVMYLGMLVFMLVWVR